jgi:hypothetical protein
MISKKAALAFAEKRKPNLKAVIINSDGSNL